MEMFLNSYFKFLKFARKKLLFTGTQTKEWNMKNSTLQMRKSPI